MVVVGKNDEILADTSNKIDVSPFIPDFRLWRGYQYYI